MDEAEFLADLGALDFEPDGAVPDQVPPQQARRESVPVMWPENVPAPTAPPDRDGVAPGTAAAVILACVAAGGAAALICRDAIVSLLTR